MNAVVDPIVLPSMSRAEADRLNRIARWRVPLPLAGNEAYSLHRLEREVREPERPADRLLVSLSIGEDPLRATMPRPLLVDLVRSLDPKLQLSPLPPSDLMALLLEAVLLPLLDVLERSSGRTISLHEVAEPADAAQPAEAGNGAGLLVGLRGPGLHQSLTVDATIGAVDRLLLIWPVGQRPLDALPVEAVLLAGSTSLPVRLLRSLRAGDAVLLQDQAAALSPDGAPSVMRLVVADTLHARVRVVQARWRLDAPLQPTTRAGQILSDNANPDPAGVVPAVTDLDEIPVRLVFEAARLELSLGALRQIGAGSVLDVDAVPGTVRILVNGRRVGDGELVSIDGRAGVRITAFAPGLDGDSVP